MADVILENEDLAYDIASRGVSYGQLLQFVHDNQIYFPKKRNMTTEDVVREIVIPDSAKKMCNYADIMTGCREGDIVIPPGRKKPRFLMSHWWGNKFMDLVQAIYQEVVRYHPGGPSEFSFYEKDYTHDQLKDTVWLCIFAVNQHRSICGTQWNPCNCGSVQFKSGPRCEMDKFDLVMKNINHHAIAIDFNLITLQRVWVLLELNEALETNMKTVYCGKPSNSLMDAIAFDGLSIVRKVQDAEASYVEDKKRILSKIENGVTFDRFNTVISENVTKSLLLLRWFEGIFRPSLRTKAKLDILAAARMLKRYPELVNAPNPFGNNKTALMYLIEWQCFDKKDELYDGEYGPNYTVDSRSVMGRLLLGYGADPNLQDSSGNTVIHYLAKNVRSASNYSCGGWCYNRCGKGVGSFRLVWDLVEMHANANIQNIKGEVPLDLCTSYKQFFQTWRDDAYALGESMVPPCQDLEAARKSYLQSQAVREKITEASGLLKATKIDVGSQEKEDFVDEEMDGALSLETLQDIDTCKKLGIDLTKREMRLSSIEFKTLFGMSKAEFSKLASWKQRKEKEKLKLF